MPVPVTVERVCYLRRFDLVYIWSHPTDIDLTKRQDHLQLYTDDGLGNRKFLELWLARTYEYRLSTQSVERGVFSAQFVHRNPEKPTEFAPAPYSKLVGITFGINQPGAPGFHESDCIERSVKEVAVEGGRKPCCICLNKKMKIVKTDALNAPFNYVPIE